jgi:hypothetical protein
LITLGGVGPRRLPDDKPEFDPICCQLLTKLFEERHPVVREHALDDQHAFHRRAVTLL